MDLASAILGLLGRVAEGISQAIAAARAKNETEAFDILDKTLSEAAASVGSVRGAIAANRAQALEELAGRFKP